MTFLHPEAEYTPQNQILRKKYPGGGSLLKFPNRENRSEQDQQTSSAAEDLEANGIIDSNTAVSNRQPGSPIRAPNPRNRPLGSDRLRWQTPREKRRSLRESPSLDISK